MDQYFHADLFRLNAGLRRFKFDLLIFQKTSGIISGNPDGAPG